MEKQQTIKLISIMYKAKLNQTSTECTEPACKFEQCICMDSEQASLLLGAFSGKDTLSMKFNDKVITYKNLQMPPEIKGICRVAGDFFSRVLTDDERREINQLIGEAVLCEGEARFAEMLSSIPVIYLTNSTNKILDRDSLNYLCVYAPCSEWYIGRLLRAAICKAVECYLNKPQEHWNDCANIIAGIFKDLNDKADSYKQINEELIKVISDYSDCLASLCQKCKEQGWGTGKIRNAKNTLDEYLTRLRTNVRYSVREAEKNIQWYRILKKIFEVMGIDVTIFPKLAFDESKKQTSDYDIIIRALAELKDDIPKRRRVFEKINEVFLQGEDITDEELIDEVVVAVGYTI